MDKKQILPLMEQDEARALQTFNEAAEDVLNASYIIVSGKISKMLQTIAQGRPLYEYLQALTQGYNFVEDFRARQFRDENDRPYIDVPKEKDALLRFAFCLLYAADTGKIGLENLLHTFYHSADANKELQAFCTELIAPFVAELNAAFAPPCVGQNVPEPPKASADESMPRTDVCADNAFSADFLPPDADAAENSLTDSLCDVTADIIGIISKDIGLTIAEREELLLICDAFATAVRVKDPKAVRVMFIALKNTVKPSPIFPAVEQKYADLCYLMGERE